MHRIRTGSAATKVFVVTCCQSCMRPCAPIRVCRFIAITTSSVLDNTIDLKHFLIACAYDNPIFYVLDCRVILCCVLFKVATEVLLEWEPGIPCKCNRFQVVWCLKIGYVWHVGAAQDLRMYTQRDFCSAFQLEAQYSLVEGRNGLHDIWPWCDVYKRAEFEMRYS